MKAVVTPKAGPPEILELRDVSIPPLCDGWALVKVRAAGLNRSEMYSRQGDSPNVLFPRIQGIECVAAYQFAFVARLEGLPAICM